MSGSFNKDRNHVAQLQRARRARSRRIDYFPSPEALKAIEARRAKEHSGSVAATNSAVINAIVTAWAIHAGLLPILTVPRVRARANDSNGLPLPPELLRTSRARARAYESGCVPGISRPIRAPVRARAYDSGGKPREICGARRHRDGQPCQAKSEPGKRRCRFHGGRSTGPRTEAGKARALANLRKGRP
jgi:hypothetical protein